MTATPNCLRPIADSPFAELKAARLSVFKYVETFYNPLRIHQTLDYPSPPALSLCFSAAINIPFVPLDPVKTT
jgi:hypothetical protein